VLWSKSGLHCSERSSAAQGATGLLQWGSAGRALGVRGRACAQAAGGWLLGRPIRG
jgi:hypothetical protein